MGGQGSTPTDTLPALPQQQIVSLSQDGTALSATAPPGVVGTKRQAEVIRQPFALRRESLQLQGCHLCLEVDATVDGTVALYTPGLEFFQEEAIVAPAASGGMVATATWPLVQAESSGQPFLRRVARGGRRMVRFDQPGEGLASGNLNMPQTIGDSVGRRWPIMLLLRPGGETQAPADRPAPDGAMLACCTLEHRSVKVVQQLLAWGNGGAYVIKDLYGIEEARADKDAESQGRCVVCWSAPKDTALMPCGHFCVCHECGTSIRITPGRNRCPLCRGDVSDLMHLELRDGALPDPTPPAAVAQDTQTSVLPGAGVPSPAAMEDTGPVTSSPSAATKAGDDLSGGGGVGSPGSPSLAEVRAARLRALEQAGPLVATGDTATGDGGSSAGATASASASSLPPKCLRRLGQEVKQSQVLRQQFLDEHGVEASLLDENDLQVWKVLIHASGVDADCQLGKQLRIWRVHAVELEVWIPSTFPVEPPRLRVLSPVFNSGSFFVHDHGALCLEALTKQGWSPAMTLPKLGVQVKAMMVQGKGSISGTGSYGSSSRQAAWKLAGKIEDAHQDWQPFSTR